MLTYQLDDVSASEVETQDSETLPDAKRSRESGGPVSLFICGGRRRVAGKASRGRAA
jgi:hypothetical protein